MKIEKKYLNHIILAVVLIILIYPWLNYGFPNTDDYRHHLSRVWFEKEEIRSMKFSEWMPFMYGGWPFFHFYHPLFYIIVLPLIVILKPILVLKLSTILAFLISLTGTYYAGKLLFNNKNSAMLASVAYALSSHFLFHATVSGALPRLMALAVLPLTSSLFIKAIEEKTKSRIILSGISGAILLMLHTSVAFPAFMIFAIYALYQSYSEKNIKSTVTGIIIAAIILGISAAWTIPLIAEKSYAGLPTYGIESPHIEQTSRTFGIIHDGTKYIRSNYFGYTVLILAIISFLIRSRTANLLKTGFVASALLYFNIFGMLSYVPFVNTAITGSTSFFIGILVFNAAMLAALSADVISKQFKKEYLVYLIAIIIIIELYPGTNSFSYGWVNQEDNFLNPPELIDAWSFIKEQPGQFMVISAIGQASEIYHGKQEFGFDWVGCPQCVQSETYALHNEIWNTFTKGSKNDTLLGYLGVKYYVLPCNVQLQNKLAYTNKAVCVYENEKFLSLIQSNAKITGEKWKLDRISFETDSKNAEKIILKVNYFKPHWHAYVDGKETEISEAWPEYMQIEVPAGIHEVVFDYRTNTTHLFAWFITFLTTILVFLIGEKTNEK